jgi:hypothetical protein
MTRAGGEKKRPRDRAAPEPAPEPDLDDLELEEEPLGGAGPEGRFLPELLRRGLTLGFTGFFMTEEALRRALGESVPRDWVDFFVEQSDRTRAEFLDRVSREFGRVFTALDPVEVLRRLLDGQTVEVSAKIRLSSSDRERGAPRRGASDRDPDRGESGT